MLLSAESEADNIVKTARENRVKKLREAMESAEAEIAVLRENEERVFQQQAKERHGHEDNSFADLDELTNKEINILEKEFNAQRGKGVSFLVDRVLSVKLMLTAAEIRAIKANNDHGHKS